MNAPRYFKDTLHLFCKEVGVPVTLVTDTHPAQTAGEVKRFSDRVRMTLCFLEKETQFIGLLKEAI